MVRITTIGLQLEAHNAHCCKSQTVGRCHLAAVVEDGRLYTWGDGILCVLGHGNRDYRLEPAEVKGELECKHVKSVSCGATQTLALTDDSQLFACGTTFSTYERKIIGGVFK